MQTDLTVLVAKARRAIESELPEDEPDTIPDWCYETIILAALPREAPPALVALVRRIQATAHKHEMRREDRYGEQSLAEQFKSQLPEMADLLAFPLPDAAPGAHGHKRREVGDV